MNRTDNGKMRKPTLVTTRFRAAHGSDSVKMTRTIPRSPSALIHRLKATKGKSDQTMLTAQNEKYNKIRPFFLSNDRTLAFLAMSTTRVATNRKVNAHMSNGLPSS